MIIPMILPMITTYDPNKKSLSGNLTISPIPSPHSPKATAIPAIAPRRERFIVPIRATGGGALLDMPDEVDFGLSPVKYEAPKTIMAGAPGRCRRSCWMVVDGI